jgi:hypothetical protein
MAIASLESSHAIVYGWRCGISAKDGEGDSGSGFENKSGYGEIRNVRISRVVNISTFIDFVGKMSKATSE